MSVTVRAFHNPKTICLDLLHILLQASTRVRALYTSNYPSKYLPDPPKLKPPTSTMPSAVKPPQTLYDKVFEDHIVEEKEDGTVLLYIGMSLCVWKLLCGSH